MTADFIDLISARTDVRVLVLCKLRLENQIFDGLGHKKSKILDKRSISVTDLNVLVHKILFYTTSIRLYQSR